MSLPIGKVGVKIVLDKEVDQELVSKIKPDIMHRMRIISKGGDYD